ncbi:hypothetical protein D3C76_1361750 [compost metagenome]
MLFGLRLRRIVFQRYNHQVEIRPKLAKAIGKAAAQVPALFATAANNDFAQVMFPGIAQYRTFFRRIGKGGGFSP